MGEVKKDLLGADSKGLEREAYHDPQNLGRYELDESVIGVDRHVAEQAVQSPKYTAFCVQLDSNWREIDNTVRSIESIDNRLLTPTDLKEIDKERASRENLVGALEAKLQQQSNILAQYKETVVHGRDNYVLATQREASPHNRLINRIDGVTAKNNAVREFIVRSRAAIAKTQEKERPTEARQEPTDAHRRAAAETVAPSGAPKPAAANLFGGASAPIAPLVASGSGGAPRIGVAPQSAAPVVSSLGGVAPSVVSMEARVKALRDSVSRLSGAKTNPVAANAVRSAAEKLARIEERIRQGSGNIENLLGYAEMSIQSAEKIEPSTSHATTDGVVQQAVSEGNSSNRIGDTKSGGIVAHELRAGHATSESGRHHQASGTHGTTGEHERGVGEHSGRVAHGKR